MSGGAVSRQPAVRVRVLGAARARALGAAEMLGRSVTRLPGILGAGCATAAAWDAFGRPAGLAALAAFLLLLDWRLP